MQLIKPDCSTGDASRRLKIYIQSSVQAAYMQVSLTNMLSYHVFESILLIMSCIWHDVFCWIGAWFPGS